MFAGHLAVSLGAKALEPRAPLSVLVAASFGLDLLWPVLLLSGVEVVRVAPGDTAFTHLAFESYPWSHSLLLVLAWAVVAWIAMQLFVGDRRVSLIAAALVVSHWGLDFVTHRPDLPLWPGGPKTGLGLWNSIPATLLLEGTLFVVAISMYVRTRKPRNAIGRWAFWALVGLTGILWISQPWSPPPPHAQAVAYVGLALWLLPPWAAWIDRNRGPARAV